MSADVLAKSMALKAVADHPHSAYDREETLSLSLTYDFADVDIMSIAISEPESPSGMFAHTFAVEYRK